MCMPQFTSHEAKQAAVEVVRAFVAAREPFGRTRMPQYDSPEYWAHLHPHPQKAIAWGANGEPGEEGIRSNRRFMWCESLGRRATDELIHGCPGCGRFHLTCCQHEKSMRCHHFRALFTDGACSNNGKVGAIAGLGGAYGVHPGQQWAYSLGASGDCTIPTSQRAELSGVLAALDKVEELVDARDFYCREGARQKHDAAYVVVTDSEYSVKGITEWYPSWKVRAQLRLQLARLSIADSSYV